MSGHVYVDETMARGFAMIAVRLRSADAARARQRMRKLLLPGQRRLHFVDEKDARRKLIVDAVAELPVTAIVYDAPDAETKRRARRRCLHALVGDCAKHGDCLLVLERVDSLLGEDEREIVQIRREYGCGDTHWRQRVEPLTERVEIV